AQSQDDVQMGVEVLADKVRPVVLRHIRLAPRGEERLASLLLAGAGGQPDTLLTPAFFGAAGDRLILDDGVHEEPIGFVQPLERTRSFVQFRFKAVESVSGTGAGYRAGADKGAPAPGHATAGHSEPVRGEAPPAETDEFSDLWETL
ncbi:MAG: hypothetical protein PVF91_12525, partial [Chromatiales bacterium]